MKSGYMSRFAALSALCALGVVASGCGGGGAAPDTHSHADGAGHDDHDHDHDHGEAASTAGSATAEPGHGGVVIERGETNAGGYAIRASRDGDVVAGKDAPIDVWVSGGAPIAAVRFWIGVEDAAGSVKAKAEIERDNWHTHVDAPSPMPEGSRLWVEIESEGGAKTIVSFDLKI